MLGPHCVSRKYGESSRDNFKATDLKSLVYSETNTPKVRERQSPTVPFTLMEGCAFYLLRFGLRQIYKSTDFVAVLLSQMIR